ncbi:MAG: hypothetical protein ACP5JH_06915 [Bacteroidota bacterium]
MGRSEEQLRDALRAIIDGRIVKRAKHELVYEGCSVADIFREELIQSGYQPMRVADVKVRIGERVPGFFIVGDTAYFGWVFFEKFSDKKARKLWGSVIRNSKGDWAIQLSASSTEIIYVNVGARQEMDVDLPISL